MSDKEVIITGAHGYVGGALSRRLVAQGYTVHRLVRHPKGRDDIAWDFTRSVAPTIRAQRNAVIVHCAASMKVNDRDALWQANVLGTRAVTELATEIAASHLILVSTGGVYSYCHEHSWKEDESVAPIGTYGHTKYLSEGVTRMYAANDGVPATVFRLFFPFDLRGEGGVSRVIVDRIRQGLPLNINKGGRPAMNPVEINDFVDLLKRCIDSAPPATGFEVYNVAGSERITFLEMCRFFEKKLELPANLAFNQHPHQDLLGDITKAKLQFQWEPGKHFID